MKKHVPTFEEHVDESNLEPANLKNPKEIIVFALEVLLGNSEMYKVPKADVYNVLDDVRKNKIKIK